MGQSKIPELEQLANQPKLVAPIEYNNPNRIRGLFYDFVRQYADHLDITIEDKTVTFIESYKQYWESFTYWFKHGKGLPIQRTQELIEDTLGLTVGPILYPILGGKATIMHSGDNITIYTPKYAGPWRLFGIHKTHEYIHAYHVIMAKDLRKKGLIEIHGYHDVDRGGPPTFFKAPSYMQLKNFEKGTIYQMIKTIRKLEKTLNSN